MNKWMDLGFILFVWGFIMCFYYNTMFMMMVYVILTSCVRFGLHYAARVDISATATLFIDIIDIHSGNWSFWRFVGNDEVLGFERVFPVLILDNLVQEIHF